MKISEKVCGPSRCEMRKRNVEKLQNPKEAFNLSHSYTTRFMKSIRRLVCLSGIFLALQGFALAQEIQWASKLDYAYNAFGTADWSGTQALGAPDVAVMGTLDKSAFRVKEESGFANLIVSYATPQKVSHVIIIESYLPGRVTEIALTDVNGSKYPIYKSKAGSATDRYRALVIAAGTEYLVEKVEVSVNTVGAPGWVQIDAIGIIDAPDLSAVDAALKKYGNFSAAEEISFSSEKEALGPGINTEYRETKPIISPDGNTLYFVRQFHPDNAGGKRDTQDIYVSTKQGNDWSPARHLGDPLNNRDGNGVGAVTPDGNTLLLIGSYDKESDAPASTSTNNGSVWNDPVPLRILRYNNTSQYSDFYLANNGRALVMAINGPDSKGDQDLYVSFLQDNGSWSQPKNMGAVLNTRMAEFSPFLAADNKTLYFSSYGHKGFGSADIYYSKRLDDTWVNWSTPKNLGNAVNTSNLDAYYAISAAGDYAYFTTDKGENRDIYRIALPGEFKPEPVLLVRGRVFNKLNNEPIGAEVLFESLPEGIAEGIANSNPRTGEFTIVLPRGKLYALTTEAEGFWGENESFDVTSITNYAEITKDLPMVPLQVGAVVKMNNLFFEKGTSELLPESIPQMDQIVSLLNANPTMEIELGGHTDNRGVPNANIRLSQDRVDEVKAYLVDMGIAAGRIQTKGYGGEKPVADNRYEETRALNRRVEIKVLKF